MNFNWRSPEKHDGHSLQNQFLPMAVSLLPMLDDLDTPEDLVRWLASAVEARELPCTSTAKMLRELGLLPGRTMLGQAR